MNTMNSNGPIFFQGNIDADDVVNETDSSSKASRLATEGAVRRETEEPKSPIEQCCGILLHLFISSPQDLPANVHESSCAGRANQDAGRANQDTYVGRRTGDTCVGRVDKGWVRDLANRCATAGETRAYMHVCVSETSVISELFSFNYSNG